MQPENWKCVDKRECARGYSIALMYGSHIESDLQYMIVLYLDGSPYWMYKNLSKSDAEAAVDDLELLPGPRGDSSWEAVLARCKTKPKGLPKSPPPAILAGAYNIKVGTWEWIQALVSARVLNTN